MRLFTDKHRHLRLLSLAMSPALLPACSWKGWPGACNHCALLACASSACAHDRCSLPGFPVLFWYTRPQVKAQLLCSFEPSKTPSYLFDYQRAFPLSHIPFWFRSATSCPTLSLTLERSTDTPTTDEAKVKVPR